MPANKRICKSHSHRPENIFRFASYSSYKKERNETLNPNIYTVNNISVFGMASIEGKIKNKM